MGLEIGLSDVSVGFVKLAVLRNSTSVAEFILRVPIFLLSDVNYVRKIILE